MTKIQEIKEQIAYDGGYTDYEDCIDECMRHYAEWYAIKCLQIASESVKTEQVMNIQQGYEPFAETRINKGSILNIKFPPHD